jgi:Xaa-Pro aminopeptidase
MGEKKENTMEQKIDFPRIPDSEFEARITNVKNKMAQQKIDLLVAYSNAFDPGHVRYFSDVFGINEAAAMVIPLEGEPTVCSGQACQAWSLYKSRIKDVKILPEVGEVSGVEYMVGDMVNFQSFFKELKEKYSISKIGTVGTTIFPQIIYAQLQQVFEGAEIVNAEPMIIEQRFIKSENEISCMRKAGEILDVSFEKVVKKIEAGWTELDIQAEITAEILKGGAESTAASWEPMIPSGIERSNLCMNRNSLRRVKDGEIICLQVGALYEGYNAALNTPLVLGKIPEEIKRAVNYAFDAREAIISTLKAGVTSRKANAAGKSVLARGGYLEHSPYAMIHNIGLLECESPWMMDDEDFVIPERAVVCIDAYMYRLPFGSFRIEDTLVIRADGVDRLTKFNNGFIPEYFA